MQDPLIGQQIGPYFIQERLQAGGMAIVYKAYDQQRREVVAFKALRENYLGHQQIVLRFKREAEIAQQLLHPHIVPFYDFGDLNGLLYMVMPLMAAGSLTDRLNQIANVPLGKTMLWLRQIASALDFAHSHGIIHRDLKPGNILLADDNTAYLCDFGIARITEATQITLTSQAGGLGTARYMSPEQASGATIDHRSDIYSFGLIAYLLITGYYPFTGENDTSIIYKHLYEPPPPPSHVNPRLPPRLDEPLLRCLAKDPGQRYYSATQFVAALEQAAAGQANLMVIVKPGAANPIPSSSIPANYPTRPGPTYQPYPPTAAPMAQPAKPGIHPAVWGFLTTLLVLLVAGIGYVLFANPKSDQLPPTPTQLVLVPSTIPSLTPDWAATTNAGAIQTAAQATAANAFLTPPTATLTPTFDPLGLAQATYNAGATLTATYGAQRTVEAELTRIGAAAATATAASWTRTPLPPTWTSLPPTWTSLPPTFTFTPTYTPSFTPTFTPTATEYVSPLDAALQRAYAGVTYNSAWSPFSQSFNGVEMVLVPAGCFQMGASDAELDFGFAICDESLALMTGGHCDYNWFIDEQPTATICFEAPFWMDRYEVTNAQFTAWGGSAGRAGDWSSDARPREQITWFEAANFCALRGARLPTEAEWEYAARGPDSLFYPWGNYFDGAVVNFCDTNCTFPQRRVNYNDGRDITGPVGNYAWGLSWVGAYDLSGNVWEWTNSLYWSYPYTGWDGRENTNDTGSERVARGGSWYDDGNNLRSAFRLHNAPGYTSNQIGLRCARSAP